MSDCSGDEKEGLVGKGKTGGGLGMIGTMEEDVLVIVVKSGDWIESNIETETETERVCVSVMVSSSGE